MRKAKVKLLTEISKKFKLSLLTWEPHQKKPQKQQSWKSYSSFPEMLQQGCSHSWLA